MVPVLMRFIHTAMGHCPLRIPLGRESVDHPAIVLGAIMQRADSPQAAALAKEVQTFLQHQALPANPNPQTLRNWYLALGERGWYVPHWPRELGGLGFSPLDSFTLQRELVAAGAPLPPGATTHLIAGWLFASLAAPQGHPQARRWLAGIAGSPVGDGEHWRVGVDLRRPDWPQLAQSGVMETENAHWVLLPVPQLGGADEADSEAQWAIGVYPGAFLAGNLAQQAAEVENLGSNPTQNPSQKPSTNVELGVEQPWPAVMVGLALDEVEALLKPVQLGWQASSGAPIPLAESATWLQVPSIGLGKRLAGLQQVLASEADEGWQAERERLHESQIALAALQVLEERAAHVATSESSEVRTAELRVIVGRSAEQLGWQVAQLEADTLGYFALPSFDEQLQHNEGPVRPAVYDPLAPQLAKR